MKLESSITVLFEEEAKNKTKNHSGKFKIYSLIMQNIDPLPSELVDFKYDLKMSTVNRQQLKDDEVEVVRKYYVGINQEYTEILGPVDTLLSPSSKLEKNSSSSSGGSRSTRRFHMTEKIKEGLQKLKDIDFLNLHTTLPIAPNQATVWEAAQAKITKDVRFLESINIMDYSLIITVAKVRPTASSLIQFEKLSENGPEKLPPTEFSMLQRNGNCLFSPSGKFAYVFGIIDILQEYDIEKKGEGGLKGVLAKFSGKSDISCQPPNTYADRFLGKLGGVFAVQGRGEDKKSAEEEAMFELSIEDLSGVKRKSE